MQFPYFHGIYEAVIQHFLSKKDSKFILNDNIIHLPRSFFVVLQVFPDKTASSLRFSAFIAYPIHSVFLTMSPAKLECFINSCCKIIWLLPVSVSEYDLDDGDLVYCMNTEETDSSALHFLIDDDVILNSSINSRGHKMLVPQRALDRALYPVSKLTNLGFEILERISEAWV